MKYILSFLFLVIGQLQAKESLDVKFLSTQRSTGNPFSIPLSIDKEGQTTFLGTKKDQLLPLRPTFLMGFNWTNMSFTRPLVLNRFNFYPVEKDLELIEVKRLRLEGGLGLSTLINSTTQVGLVPYKGAFNTVIRNKKNTEKNSIPISLPQNLSDLGRWKNEDIGIYQTYGGIIVYAGFSAGMMNISQFSLGFQNQFIVEMVKVEKDKVSIKISEETSRRRQVVLGPFLTKASYGQFNGRRFSYEFELNPSNKSHHRYYQEALKGNLLELQQKLPVNAQRVTWTGADHRFFIGVPVLMGKTFLKGHYEFDTDGKELELNFKGSENRGIITPMRNFHDYVYQTKENLVLIWTSEMKKADDKLIENRFLSKGRIIGVKGFNRELPAGAQFGSVVSHLGISFSRSEVLALKDMSADEFQHNLRIRCEEQRLSCRRDEKFKKIIGTFERILQKPLKDMKKELGLLSMKEPALIYAMIKTLNLKKQMYFKFLSENFQSLEGSSPVEI